MCLIVESPEIMMREEAPNKLFKLHKQWGFFLAYSLLMSKCRNFSPKLQNDPSSTMGLLRGIFETSLHLSNISFSWHKCRMIAFNYREEMLTYHPVVFKIGTCATTITLFITKINNIFFLL